VLLWSADLFLHHSDVEPSRGGYLCGPKADMTEKRSEPRFTTEGQGTLQEIHPLSLERHNVKIVDVSKDGLGIVSAKVGLPGTIVQLRIQR